jgi:hypothetical protein
LFNGSEGIIPFVHIDFPADPFAPPINTSSIPSPLYPTASADLLAKALKLILQNQNRCNHFLYELKMIFFNEQWF